MSECEQWALQTKTVDISRSGVQGEVLGRCDAVVLTIDTRIQLQVLL